MREVSVGEVESLVQGDGLTIVDCYAPWCGPCQTLKPSLESLSQCYTDVTFLALNIDGAMEFTMEHGIRSIPTLLFYRSGRVVCTVTGVPSGSVLQEKIEAHR